VALSPIFIELKASIGEFQAKMGEAAAEIEHLSKKGAGSFAKLQQVGKAAFLGTVGVVAGLGAASLELADKFEVSHAKLEASLAALHTPFEDVKRLVGATDKAMEKLGFTNTDTEEAFANLATATHSAAKAAAMMGDAANLARYKHITLADASSILAKASAGSTRAFKELGITLETGVPHAEALQRAMRELHERIGGQASTAVATFGGKVGVLKVQAEDLGVKIGLKLIPVIEKLMAGLSKATGYLEKHTTQAKALAAVVGGVLVGAIGAWVAGLVASAATAVGSFATMMAAGAAWAGEQLLKLYIVGATWAMTMGAMVAEALAWAAGMLVAGATALLPFLPIIAICAVVAVAAYELYRHWGTVWGLIKGAVKAGWDFIKQHFELIIAVALGPLALAAYELYKHWSAIWDGIKTVTGAVWGFLKTVFGAIVEAGIWYVKAEIKGLETVWHAIWGSIHAVVSATWGALKVVFSSIVSGGLWLIKHEVSGLETIWANVWGGIQTVVSDVWDFLKPIFDKISKGVGGIVSAVGKVGGVIGKAASIIPHAQGGYAHPNELALVGEQGPEIIRMGTLGGYVHTAGTSAAMMGAGTAPRRGGGDTVVNVTVQGNVTSERALAGVIHTELLKQKARGGNLGLA
jgi:phage-related protein